MPSEQAALLYGVPRPKSKPKSTVTDSSTLSFASNLTSLLSSSSARSSARSKKNANDPLTPAHSRKDDIFSVHKKAKSQGGESKGRSHKGREDTTSMKQKHRTAEDVGGADQEVLKRSKRKMEEKARLYAAMKRGDYIDPTAQRLAGTGMADVFAEERGPLIDFDRKWAENGEEEAETSSDDGPNSEEEELVEYTDEFGRGRKGTRAEVARETRKQRIAANAKMELEEITGRPAAPSDEQDGSSSGIIFGDAVQSAAFNPNYTVSEQMAALAAKRDRSLTPPPDTHYDASKEFRTKGVGFYQFSQEKEMREQEMAALAEQRAETTRMEKEREERRQKKAKDIEERRAALKERRNKKQADAFLSGLELDGPGAEGTS